ncbi:hypothetical protein O9929_24080 [Vibrio lentus]|nr:hypothetical protein [Vibrio lentus]
MFTTEPQQSKGDAVLRMDTGTVMAYGASYGNGLGWKLMGSIVRC